MEPTPTTEITLDKYFVQSDNQEASGPGAIDTATVTFVSETDPTKTIPYTTTVPAAIAALTGGSEWELVLRLVPPAAPAAAEESSASGSESSIAPQSTEEIATT